MHRPAPPLSPRQLLKFAFPFAEYWERFPVRCRSSAGNCCDEVVHFEPGKTFFNRNRRAAAGLRDAVYAFCNISAGARGRGGEGCSDCRWSVRRWGASPRADRKGSKELLQCAMP